MNTGEHEHFIDGGDLTSLSDLLYGTFLSGDGNFHAQLMLRCKGLKEDPSYFGDAGLWAPYLTYHNYWKSAQKEPTASSKVILPPK